MKVGWATPVRPPPRHCESREANVGASPPTTAMILRQPAATSEHKKLSGQFLDLIVMSY
jgi:hypothetical protein